MKRLLQQYSTAGWVILSTGVILVALLLTLARLVLPTVTAYRGEIEQFLGQTIDHPVTIGSIEARWVDFSPHVSLRDVRVLDRENEEPLLTLEEVYLKIDWIDSVWRRSLVVDSLAVRGSTLGIVRKSDGAIEFMGFDAGGGRDLGWLRARLLRRSGLKLQWLDSRVSWRDESSGAEHLLDGVDISVEHREDRYHLLAYVKLPPELGKDIELIARIRSADLTQETLEGSAWIRARNVRVGQLSDLGLPGVQRSRDSDLSFELWSQWRQGRPVRVSGRVDMAQVVIDPWIVIPGMDRRPERIDRFSADGRWSGNPRDWRLDLENISIAIGGQDMPGTEAALAYRVGADGTAVWRGRFDALSLGGLTRLVSRHRESAGFLEGVSGYRSLEGTLRDVLLVLRLRDGSLDRFGVSADFEDLGVGSFQDLPSVSGLDGRLSLDERSGEVVLESSGVSIGLASLFPAPLYLEGLNGGVEWGWDGYLLKVRTDALSLDNEDIRIDLSADACWGNGTRWLDLEAAFGDGDGSALGRYLPVRVMKPKVARWLEDSILDGHVVSGGAVLRGDLSSFPFDTGDGQFSVWARIHDGVLVPRPTDLTISDIDADLAIEGRSLSLRSDHAVASGLTVTGADARIPVLNRARLHFSAQANGPFAGIAGVLEEMKPKAQRAHGRHDFRYSGNGTLALDLKLPLARKLRAVEKPAASGTVELDDVGIGLGFAGLAFEGINGLVHFSPDGGVRGEGLAASFAGSPVEGRIEPGPDKSTIIQVRGSVDTGQALAETTSPLSQFVRGKTLWDARAVVSRFREGKGRSIDVSVESDLTGVSVDLPAPLGKGETAPGSLSVSTTIDPGTLEPLKIGYGGDDGLSSIVKLSRKGEDLEIDRAEIVLGPGSPALPTDGIRIRGHVERVPLGDWFEWYAGFAESGKSKPAGSGAGELVASIREIDVGADEVELGGREVRDLKVLARKRYRDWTVETSSSLAAGTLNVPAVTDSAHPVRIDLDYLNLPLVEGRETPDPPTPSPPADRSPVRLNPGSLPPLKVRIERVSLGERDFGGLRLQTSRIADGMHIHDLEMRADNIVGHISGAWRMTGRGRQTTSLFTKFKSPDLGTAFRRLELDDSLEGGRAELEFNVSWPDAPFHPVFEGLRARGQVSMTDGRILNIEPGLGRVLGLINPAVLQRRLTLDFRDMFQKGFAFDSIAGNLVMVDSDLYARDIVITGPSSKVEITGRTGLQARDYDQIVAVTPQLGLGPAIAGAVIGGPAVGAAVFVADRLLKESGADLSSVSRIELKVTGPWDDISVRPANLGESGGVELYEIDGE